MKGQLRSDIPISDAPNLQRLVYDIAVAATKCNPTQAHSAREAVIKCRCMEAPLCGERTSYLDCLAPSSQRNSVVTAVLPLMAIQRQHDKRKNNEINRLHKLGNTSRRAANVVGDP